MTDQNIINRHSVDPFADVTSLSAVDSWVTSSAVDQRSSNLIYICIQQRSGKKILPTGIGREFDKKRLLRAFKKKFTCNGTVVEHQEYGEVIQPQDDQRTNVNMANSLTTDYSINSVYKAFQNVMDKSDHETIHLREFVIAFRELSKFFNHLNVVFSFVAHDLVDKFDLIDSCIKNNPIQYQTVQTMIEHERFLEDRGGTIALLRLLRALEFTYMFLERAIVSPTDNTAPKHIAWHVYKQTLHKRHSKAVRASIWLATATIPKREVLKQTLLRGETEPHTDEKCFPVIGNVYRHIHKIYEQNHFLELTHL
ncbi:hypothetical protein I4U23_013083 [Adineta vaga]|nr:hypothetical protein I4U23_013083 [Adineta vaga]